MNSIFNKETFYIKDEEPELSVAKIMIALILVGAVVLFLNVYLAQKEMALHEVEKSLQTNK